MEFGKLDCDLLWLNSIVADLDSDMSETGSSFGLRPASELDSVMEFGLRHAHDMHTQVFVQLASSSRAGRKLDSVKFGRELVCELDSVMEFGLK